MKSKFTLLAIALLSVCAFAATTWKASEETPVAAGSTLIDDELVTAKTVYETTLKSAVKTIAGEEFTHYIQVRNAANPSADAPDGTEQSGSTSIVLEVKKDVSLKIYYRRQCKSGESGVYESNDGKDLKIFSRADFSVLDGTITVSEETEDQAYAWVTKDYQLTGGETYVISARGTTINYYGMTFEALEVPVTPIVLDLATGTDITTALNEVVE
ncbi:MAG: hypothetical protein J6W77_01390, partial [Prevotella sp.]|nr:hypothetical protein [Prevotella sp.]